MIDALMLLGENRFGASITAREALDLSGSLGIETIVAAPARPAAYHLEPANEAVRGRRLSHELQLDRVGELEVVSDTVEQLTGHRPGPCVACSPPEPMTPAPPKPATTSRPI